MLPADERKLYVEALMAPAGFELDEAVATTYSLSLESLLAIPVHLVLGGLDPKRLGEAGDVWILDAIRRAAGRLTVFCDAACIAPPRADHMLFGLLEPCVVPVRAPNEGAFHPKLWVLRFRSLEGAAPLVRVLVLSRNLSPDRSWDLSLQLEGRVGGAYVGNVRALGEFVAHLPNLAARKLARGQVTRVEQLADDLRHTHLSPPDRFDELAFHVLGLDSAPWSPGRSDRLAVVSPFVTKGALEMLARSTSAPVALVSRAEELDRIPADVLGRFARVAVLHEAAQSEDGEDSESAGVGLRGLHAKLYMAKRGWNTHVYVGSANATHAALEGAANVELLAELVGKTSQLPGNGIDGLLGDDGIGGLLVDYQPLATPTVLDAEEERARHLLEAVPNLLLEADVLVRFSRDGEQVLPTLEARRRPRLDGVAALRAWLVTTSPSSGGADASLLTQGGAVALPMCSVAAATSFVAFECSSAIKEGVRATFVLSVRTENMPSDRDAHIVQQVVNNRDRFLDYLASLLAGLDDQDLGATLAMAAGDPGRAARGVAHSGLLERLVRARARHPERMKQVAALVRTLRETPDGESILPPDFVAVWAILGADAS